MPKFALLQHAKKAVIDKIMTASFFIFVSFWL